MRTITDFCKIYAVANPDFTVLLKTSQFLRKVCSLFLLVAVGTKVINLSLLDLEEREKMKLLLPVIV